MATEDKLLNGAGLSRLASDIKGYVANQAEVFVGPEPPVAGNYKLWVDTNETPSSFLKSGDNVTELTNDAGYITSAYHDTTKQDKLTAGANIDITNNVISATDTTYSEATTSQSGLMSSADKTKLNGISTQAKYVAVSGSGTATNEVNYITIDNTEYKLAGSSGEPAAYLKSASVSGKVLTITDKDDQVTTFTDTDTTYSAGTNVQISAQNVISATDTTYSAGANVSISADNIISATDTTYSEATTSTAGLMSSTDKSKLDSLNSVSGTNDGTNWTTITIGDVTKNIPVGGSGEPNAYIKDASVSGNTLTLTKKDDTTVAFTPQDTTYTAGQNIQISAQNVISATDTTYSAGTGIAISNGVISNTGLTAVPNATATVVGGITVRLSGTTLYIRNDGQEA